MTDTSTTAEPPERKAGKRGLKRESHEPRLLLSELRKEGYERAEAAEDWDGTHAIAAWGMDGNDKYGDCGPAATDHGRMALAGDASLLNTLGLPTYEGTLPTYFAYGKAQGEAGPEPDEGVDNRSWFGWLYEQGLVDWYAEAPLDELPTVAQEFNGAVVAQSLSDNAEQQFEENVAWGQPGDTPDPGEGHDTLLIKTYAPGDGSPLAGGGAMVTWAAVHDVTPEYLDPKNGFVLDAWVAGTWEDAEKGGLDRAKLEAALAEVHGHEKPGPAPEPAPAPPPADGTPGSFIAELEHEAHEAISRLVGLVEHFGGHVEHWTGPRAHVSRAGEPAPGTDGLTR